MDDTSENLDESGASVATDPGADDGGFDADTPGGFADGAGGFAADALPVDPAPYPDLSHVAAQPGEPRDLRLLSDIELELCVEIGRARLPLRQLLALTPGSVVELDRALGEPVDVLVNGKLVARGQIVTIADEFGVRLSEIIDPSVGPAPTKRRG